MRYRRRTPTPKVRRAGAPPATPGGTDEVVGTWCSDRSEASDCVGRGRGYGTALLAQTAFVFGVHPSARPCACQPCSHAINGLATTKFGPYTARAADCPAKLQPARVQPRGSELCYPGAILAKSECLAFFGSCMRRAQASPANSWLAFACS